MLMILFSSGKDFLPPIDTRAIQTMALIGQPFIQSAKLISSVGEDDGSLTSIVFSPQWICSLGKECLQIETSFCPCLMSMVRRNKWNENQFIHMCVFHWTNEPNKTLSFRIVLRRWWLFIYHKIDVPNDRLRNVLLAVPLHWRYNTSMIHQRRNDRE